MCDDLTAWRAALAAEPGNCLMRAVFADWLDEQDDPELRALADGYRAMGTLRVSVNGKYSHGIVAWPFGHKDVSRDPGAVTLAWYHAAGGMIHTTVAKRGEPLHVAEDRIARAWAKLTPAEQAKAVALMTLEVPA